MAGDYLSRRLFLAATGAAGAAWLATRAEDLDASLTHAAHARRAVDGGGPPPPLEVLTPEQAADIEAIAAQIIPSDELPGAREARVVNFMDHALATWGREQKDPLLQGLAAFNTAVAQRYSGVPRFALLSAEQQLEFLRANERHPLFQNVRQATLVGTFANPSNGGNYEKAGYRILGYDDRGVWRPPFGWYDARANGGPN